VTVFRGVFGGVTVELFACVRWAAARELALGWLADIVCSEAGHSTGVADGDCKGKVLV
jgi:hypothetical protein